MIALTGVSITKDQTVVCEGPVLLSIPSTATIGVDTRS